MPIPFQNRRIGLLWRRASARMRLVQALIEEVKEKEGK